MIMKTKVKKEGWVNVYHVINNSYDVGHTVYETEKEAIECRADDCIATVKIEWEE